MLFFVFCTCAAVRCHSEFNMSACAVFHVGDVSVCFLASVFICEKVRDAFGVANEPIEVFHASL